MDTDSDTFSVTAERSFYIEYEPVIKEKKKKKEPNQDDTINKPIRRKKEKKFILISGKAQVS